jgi:hypothetical protein
VRQLPEELAGDRNPQRGDRVGIMPFGAEAATLASGSPEAARGLTVQHGRRGLRGERFRSLIRNPYAAMHKVAW